ncbi:Cys/Met metabolism PLP-dependent enzyme-domain-containing protein [Talaromyces proteolyticus]|uniref:Cys/Met metabolism PLP-dependent enzyme-domain-containing protein n=1 Tax=Talaromyces proteolyticus TaxID=1131652 RepID=A0AAD4L3W1_9EURO|nr:Cys/Met metabolism PLP-dependent enzyme-domain-containing protein [Talaromyces proteolyticus]KAH8703738.1 Cys/Met metabolism PLP-dependent enzyme-domain-containing protein [Talaromyces proteolyticus]
MAARGNLATLALHADNELPEESDVAPPIHLSTTFRYINQVNNQEAPEGPVVGPYIYSRTRTPTRTRLEVVLSALIHGPTLTYASGVAAVHAYLVFLKPKRVAIGPGYYGSRNVVELHRQLTGCEILGLDDLDALREGDVIQLETPVNPTGEAISIEYFAGEAHKRGAYLVVDSTFGPPGIQDPFLFGADIIIHSGTKYFGGHHDLLCGTLSIPPARESEWFDKLHSQRTILGSVLGSVEVWLSLRSLRTLDLRVKRQSQNATALVQWIEDQLKSQEKNVVKRTVSAVRHASLQIEEMHWLRQQMPNGFGPVFALEMLDEDMARRLTGLLKLFQNATSLGGVESQLEWRRLVDPSEKPNLLRVSVGVEDLEDLKADLLEAFIALDKSGS